MGREEGKSSCVPECELVMVQGGYPMLGGGGGAAAAAPKRLPVRVSALLHLLAALGGIEAEQTGDNDAELEEDDSGGRGDDDRQRGAEQLTLLVSVDDDWGKVTNIQATKNRVEKN